MQKGPASVVKIVAVQLIKWEMGTLPVLEASGGAAARGKLGQVLLRENTTSGRNKGPPISQEESNRLQRVTKHLTGCLILAAEC